MFVACQKIQEHVKEARDKNVITPPQLSAPQPQKFAKMRKNAKGVYLRASTCLYNLYTINYGCLYMSTLVYTCIHKNIHLYMILISVIITTINYSHS